MIFAMQSRKYWRVIEIGTLTSLIVSLTLQSCLSIACHVAGSLDKNVVYIDTTGGFSSQRIHEILMSRHDDNTMVSHRC